jgi:hypothetical protein
MHGARCGRITRSNPHGRRFATDIIRKIAEDRAQKIRRLKKNIPPEGLLPLQSKYLAVKEAYAPIPAS